MVLEVLDFLHNSFQKEYIVLEMVMSIHPKLGSGSVCPIRAQLFLDRPITGRLGIIVFSPGQQSNYYSMANELNIKYSRNYMGGKNDQNGANSVLLLDALMQPVK